MFKIEKPTYANRTFRIEEKLLERLEYIAAKENISVNALVVQCCKYALNDMDEGVKETQEQ